MMSEKRFCIDEKTNYKDYPIILDTKTGDWWVIQDTMMGTGKLLDLLNEQQELIEELQVSDEMGWKRAERFEKKCPKELHNKKMYIKRLEYKVQKFKEENEQLKEELNNLKKDETMLYHYYTLARYGGDGV